MNVMHPLAVLHAPLVVPSQNVRERMHWREQRAEVRTWATWFTFQRATAGLPKATSHRHVAILSFRRQLCRDHANLVGGCKGLIDGLVDSGWLVDDAIAWMTATYDQQLASRAPDRQPSTRIIVSSHPIAKLEGE